jgi:hypothetical protein
VVTFLFTDVEGSTRRWEADAGEGESRLRAELAAKLGYIPASMAPDDIERDRRLSAAADRSPSQERTVRKAAHLRAEAPHRD